jgi:hypothetical protein
MAFKDRMALLSAPIRLSLGSWEQLRFLTVSHQISSTASSGRVPIVFHTTQDILNGDTRWSNSTVQALAQWHFIQIDHSPLVVGWARWVLRLLQLLAVSGSYIICYA